MARPIGSKNRKKPGDPDYVKMGFPSGATKIVESMPVAEIISTKLKILEMFDNREIDNLSQAGNKLGLSKTRLYRWKEKDKFWSEQINQAKELIADELEQELKNHDGRFMPYVTTRIFMLKALRPNMYRDNAKLDVTDSKLTALLEELKALTVKESKKVVPSEPPKEETKK